ncbi:hypothetical protein GCM10009792_22250 [Microcella alkalica]
MDLEQCDDVELTEVLTGRDPVVFAAGFGPGRTPECKVNVDRDGTKLLADAAAQPRIRRHALVARG